MIVIKSAGRTISPTTIQFSGGELHVKLPTMNIVGSDEIQVVAQIQSSNDLVELLHVKEILDRLYPDNSKILVLPYLPYGRQDRVTEKHTSFTLKTFANLINSLHFNKVVTYDAHSDVSLALINRIENIDIDTILAREQSPLYEAINRALVGFDVTIVAPDAGAAKRLTKVIDRIQIDCLTLQKHRDVTTGNITMQPVATRHEGVAVIIDDICDGGATFVQAAKVLREAGFTEVWLYVTHGIFAKGLETLFQGGIDKVFTTNSFYNSEVFINNYRDRVVVDSII